MDVLFNKLASLLTQYDAQLMQTYNSKDIEWIESINSFGNKLSRLWGMVLGDKNLESMLFLKIEPLLPATENWDKLFKEGSMEQLLSLSNHLSDNDKSKVWQQAAPNALNSEDAAAIANFYHNSTTVQQVLRPNLNDIIQKLLIVCMEEIERTIDPDHLGAILSDLYIVEDSFDVDIGELKYLILQKIEKAYYGDDEDYFDSDESIYYNYPEITNNNEEIKTQLIGMINQVNEKFDGLLDDN